MKNNLYLLSILTIFPYLVGFAPPDSSGTFISLSGGKGVYPTASCSGRYSNDYQEGALSVDRRIQTSKEGEGNWITPQYVTLGLFGQVGSDQKINETYGDVTTLSMSAGGMHAALDWQWIGLDLGVLALDLPDIKPGVLPRAGLRLGPPIFYVSSSFMEGSPLYSDGNYINVGIGTSQGPLQLWAGLGGGPPVQGAEPVGILRMRYNFKPVTLGLTFEHGDPSGKEKNYGIAANLEFRLPGK